MSVSTHTIDLDDPEQTEETVETAEEMAPKHKEITGRRADELVEGARAAGSGRAQAWEQAVVQRFEGTELVTVPLTGTHVPELSKVTYFEQGPKAEWSNGPPHSSQRTRSMSAAGRTARRSARRRSSLNGSQRTRGRSPPSV